VEEVHGAKEKHSHFDNKAKRKRGREEGTQKSIFAEIRSPTSYQAKTASRARKGPEGHACPFFSFGEGLIRRRSF